MEFENTNIDDSVYNAGLVIYLLLPISENNIHS